MDRLLTRERTRVSPVPKPKRARGTFPDLSRRPCRNPETGALDTSPVLVGPRLVGGGGSFGPLGPFLWWVSRGASLAMLNELGSTTGSFSLLGRPFHYSLLPPESLLLLLFKKHLLFWLCWVFVSGQGLSLAGENRGYPSLPWLLFWQSTGSRRTGSVVVAHGLGCSTACGIFPDQGSNLCPLH